MADKWFTLSDMELHRQGIPLIRPPFSRKDEKASKEKVLNTNCKKVEKVLNTNCKKVEKVLNTICKKVANASIYVENVIARLCYF